jgi:hypothetical protein
MAQSRSTSREVVEWGRRTAMVALKSSKVGIRSVLVSVSPVEMRLEPRATRVARRRRSLRTLKLGCIVVIGKSRVGLEIGLVGLKELEGLEGLEKW